MASSTYHPTRKEPYLNLPADPGLLFGPEHSPGSSWFLRGDGVAAGM